MLSSELIYGFSGSLLAPYYDNPKPIPDFHQQLWEYCCLPDPWVAIAAPRGHAKSTAITQAYALAALLFRECSFLVILSGTEPQAIEFLKNIKVQLQDNLDLIRLFKVNPKFSKDSEKEIEGEIGEDKQPFKILVRSANGGSGSVRGFLWRNKRPDLIICDDIEDDEAVMNEERRAKMRTWFFNALIPSLSDNGKIRFVGTILHFDSLLERLMPKTSGEGMEFTQTEGLCQWSNDPDQVWKAIKYRAHTGFDDFTEILWPEKYPPDRLKKLRRAYIQQGNPEGYSQEYLNYPHEESVAFFRRQDFIPMEAEDYKTIKRYYAAVDLAVSKKA